jgi:pimeloyl-ACP methyl ester carboxylesterase
MPSHDALNTPTQFVDINRHRIAYRVFGRGMPIILCAPFGTPQNAWDPGFIDALSARFRVITFDYAGIGDSTGPRGVTASALSRDAIDLADALCVDIFALAGWSLGGFVVQAITQSFPDRVSHEILIAAPPAFTVKGRVIRKIIGQALTSDSSSLKGSFFDDGSERSRDATETSKARLAQWPIMTAPDSSSIEPQKFVLRDEWVRIFLSGISDDAAAIVSKIPALAIFGARDPLFSAKDRARVIDQSCRLYMLIIPDAAHAPHHQFPEFCANIIGSFIADID